MGSFCATEGFRASISRTASSLCGSSGIFYDQRPVEKSVVTRGSVSTSPKECIGRSKSTSRLGVLLSSLSCTQKEWTNETCVGPLFSESVSGDSTFQNGDQQVDQNLSPYRDVDVFFRSDGCLFSCPYSSGLSEVSSSGLGGQGICFQGNAFWPIYCSTSVHKNFSNSGCVSTLPVHFHPYISRRFSDQEFFFQPSSSTYSSSYSSSVEAGFPYFLGKIRDSSQSEFHFPRGTISNRSWDSSSSRGEISQASVSVGSTTFSQTGFSSPVSTTDRFSDFSDGHSTFRSSSYSPHSVVSSGILGTSLTTVGSCYSHSSQIVSSSSVVVSERECYDRLLARPPSSFYDPVYRCFSDRLGSYPGRQRGIRYMVRSPVDRTHQFTGDAGCSSGIETLFPICSGSISDDSHRQYNSSGLSAESGRHTFSVSLPSVQRNSVVLPFPGNSLVSQACSWQSESSSGCSLKVTASSEYRMGVTSSSLSGDLSQVGSSSYRPLCYASELQTANVCVSDSRQQSFSSGCNVFRLEGDVFLHVSSFSPPSQDFTQNQGRNLQDHSYCSSMAKTILVSRSSSTVLCETNSASSQERSFVSIQRQESSSESFQPPSTRMVTVRESLRQDGFSDRAAKRISSSVRKSTGAIYDSKWNIFCSWCRSKEIDPLAVTVQQLAEFLVYLFEDKGFSPSTIKGYRSALSRTIALSGGPDFGKNEFLSLMVKNFCLERPRQRRLVPSWNLALVLRTLQFPPFEPLFLAPFKFLTLKCCFLLALASGRRRSEIHAFSIADSCLRFSADNSSVTLLTDPSFLAKNQLSDKGSGPIVIPALPKSLGNQDLCPVRTLQKYISVSSTLRPSGSTRLFIPIKKGLSDISAKTISTWLCHTVKMAYQSSSPEALSRVQVQAHEIRALSCSWAIFNSSSMSEIMSAGYWRSDSTFYNHYLRSMPLHSDSLFSLGPLVSAQKVVFPPSCQSQGDSALL